MPPHREMCDPRVRIRFAGVEEESHSGRGVDRFDCHSIFYQISPAECLPFPRLYIGARKAEIPQFFHLDFRTENLRNLSLANIEFIGFAAVNRFAFLGFFHQVVCLGFTAPGFLDYGLHKRGFAYAINPGLSCLLHNIGKACG